MTGNNPVSQSTGQRPPWLIIIPFIFACGTLACGALGVTSQGVGQEQGWVPPHIAPWIGLPAMVIGALGTGLILSIAEIGFWRRLTKRSHRTLFSLAVGVLGILGIPTAIGIIALTVSLPADWPWSLLIGLPAIALVMLAISLVIGVLVGPALLIASLVVKTTAASSLPAQPPPAKRVCPACGAENPADYSFCERCGSEL
ncbi:MAG: zinc ribbon domain-containing protein [Anaerolineae bacterium]|nr:zinc ribbon domain-containing protein [Anaerolineae bacterium]